MWIGGGWGFHNGLIRSCGRETTLLVGGAQPAGLVDGWGRVGGCRMWIEVWWSWSQTGLEVILKLSLPP